MTVGALCDLGVPPSTLEWELSKLDLGDFHLHFERQERGGVHGVRFSVHGGAVHTHDQDEPADEHGQIHAHEHGDAHGHEHGEDCGCGHDHDEPVRSYPELLASIQDSDLSPFVKQHAASLLTRIATAEAGVREAAPEAVAFSVDAALDTLADLVCVCAGIEALGVERILVGPLVDGRGWTEAGPHGRFPVPSPATVEVLRAAGAPPLGTRDEPYEFVTPTGAALAVEFATAPGGLGGGFGPMPAGLRVEKTGHGFGTRELPDRVNALRAVLGTLET